MVLVPRLQSVKSACFTFIVNSRNTGARSNTGKIVYFYITYKHIYKNKTTVKCACCYGFKSDDFTRTMWVKSYDFTRTMWVMSNKS